MGRMYGYTEDFGRKLGRHKICTFCDSQLRSKGYLSICENKRLLPSGEIVETRQTE